LEIRPGRIDQAQTGSRLAAGGILVTNNHKSKARILVVDDEAGMREGCRRALEPASYTVDTAEDVTTGLNLVRRGHYDLYLVDVMLPDGSGLDLVEQILEVDSRAVCIIITGFGTVEMAVEAIQLGAYDFLSKPFTTDELLVAVSRGLERRQLKDVQEQAVELARAKTELERLDEAKSHLMLKVAHELRAPVAAVQSYINLILAGYITGNDVKPTLTRVQERLQEMLDLISDLLELARLRQAKDQIVAEASLQPVADILEEVVGLFREQAHQKKQSFQVEIMNRPTLKADQKNLRQIWTNLISNAIKYTPEGGRIEVSLGTEDGQVVGMVADSGIGIAEEDMPHLFQDFFRTDQAKSSGAIGTGLGLSIVKQIVESYGGEIKVTSRLGEGTRFTFTLPLEQKEAKPQEEITAPKASPRRRLALPTTHSRAIILGEDSVRGDRT
jgi:signal transduction histidine kinase